MTRALLVALLLAAGCGGEIGHEDVRWHLSRRPAPPEPEAQWTFSAEGMLACPGAARTGDLRTSAWDQWCIWDCTTVDGLSHQFLAVRYSARFDEAAYRDTGAWVLLAWDESIITRENADLCRWLP